jgi:hypothetical protein
MRLLRLHPPSRYGHQAIRWPASQVKIPKIYGNSDKLQRSGDHLWRGGGPRRAPLQANIVVYENLA